MDYQASDVVACKVNDREIVPATTQVYERSVSLEIVAEIEDAYLAFVPVTANLRRGFIYDAKMQRRYPEVDQRFCDSHLIIITESDITRLVQRYDGVCCSQCDEFYAMAEGNQEDGTLICYLCRQNPWR